MQITSLVENSTMAGRDGLVSEHGLALHVQLGELRILFDTGASGALVDNAQILGIDLAEVDLVVISHHHYDHGGGLERFLGINSKARVLLRASPPADRFIRLLGVVRKQIGLDRSLLERFADRFESVSEDLEVEPGVHLITGIGSAHPRPSGNRHLLVERDGRLEPDPFDHELVMVLQEEDGIVVFTGCSHGGILNLVDAGIGRFPGLPVKAVIGGFHLIGNPWLGTMAHSREEVEEIGRRILERAPSRVYTGHCTGKKAFEVLQGVMGDLLQPFPTGATAEV